MGCRFALLLVYCTTVLRHAGVLCTLVNRIQRDKGGVCVESSQGCKLPVRAYFMLFVPF